ncbi:MAG: hypothetical protein IJU95_04390 [Treponema sp.]|nr:hypothetical protein [Treponema sp.]
MMQRNGGQVVFQSRRRLLYYVFLGWLWPFLWPVVNGVFCWKLRDDMITPDLLIAPALCIILQTLFNVIMSGNFTLTDTQLRIRQTIFLTSEIRYPLASIQGHALGEARFKSHHFYRLMIQSNNASISYLLFQLSQKSIDTLQALPFYRGSSASNEQAERHYVPSLYCVLSIFNVLCLLYLLGLYLFQLTSG